jgi:hypothetical protein
MQLLVPVTNPAALRKSQQAFDFDADVHPRAPKGAEDGKGGQFVRKEDAPEGPVHHDTYAGSRHTYGATNRPVGYSHVPDGWIIGSDKPHPDYRHGTVDYPRPLTEQELTSYELEKVHPHEEGGLSVKDMRRAGGFLEDMLREGWEGQEKQDLDALKQAYDGGPRALADFLRATQDTNDFSLTLAPDVVLPILTKSVMVPVTNPAALKKGQGSFEFDEGKHPRGEKGSGQGGKFVAKDHSDEELHQHWQDAHQQKKTLDKQRAKGKVNYEDHFHQSQALDTKKRQIEAELSDRRIAEHNRQREEADKHELDVDAETGKIRTDPNTGSMWRRKVNKSLAVLVPITLR